MPDELGRLDVLCVTGLFAVVWAGGMTRPLGMPYRGTVSPSRARGGDDAQSSLSAPSGAT